MPDFEAWQKSKLDRLTVKEKAPVMTAWLAITVAAVASPIIGSSAQWG